MPALRDASRSPTSSDSSRGLFITSLRRLDGDSGAIVIDRCPPAARSSARSLPVLEIRTDGSEYLTCLSRIHAKISPISLWSKNAELMHVTRSRPERESPCSKISFTLLEERSRLGL